MTKQRRTFASIHSTPARLLDGALQLPGACMRSPGCGMQLPDGAIQVPGEAIQTGRVPADGTGTRLLLAAVATLALSLLAGCGGGMGMQEEAPGPSADAQGSDAPVVQPGAPGTESRVLASDRALAPYLPHTEADVQFMQNMIHHHAQALEMSALAMERSEDPQILLLARRIDRSQQDEIDLMARWLETRGEAVPAVAGPEPEHGAMGGHEDHHPDDPSAGAQGDPMMAGMLSAEQMAELAAARGETFDRLFLEAMIYHHEGAIDMVEELFASPGAGQGAEIYQFASHVDSDQRMEIGRMYRMLNQIPTS